MIGRSFEREKSIAHVVIEPAVPVRSSMADARGSILFDYDDAEKQDHETEKQPPIPMRRKSQTDQHSKDLMDGDVALQHQHLQQQLQQLQQQQQQSSVLAEDVVQPIRKTTFATLPNMTTWQQQSVNHQKPDHKGKN